MKIPADVDAQKTKNNTTAHQDKKEECNTTPSPYQDPGGIFAGTAGFYASVRPGYPAELIDYVADLSRRTPAARVVDMGTGPGAVALALAERRLHVVGVDPCEEMLEQARDQAALRGLTERVEWRCGQAEEALHGIGPVSMVTMGDVFHWLDGSALRSVGRIGHYPGHWFARSHHLPLSRLHRCTQPALAPFRTPGSAGPGWRNRRRRNPASHRRP